MSSIELIRNYVRLTPSIGTAGQPAEDQFKLIADEGFATVLNIAMPDHPDSIDHEGALVTALGMNYIHLPVPFATPEVDHLRQFFSLMETQKNKPVFVHCIMNYRVSAFMYHYLTLIKGFNSSEARSPIFDIWEIEPQWQAIMELDKDRILAAGN